METLLNIDGMLALRKENADLRARLSQHEDKIRSLAEHYDALLRNDATGYQRVIDIKKARIAELEAGYREAMEDIEAWAAYASDYCKEKHRLRECLDVHASILAGAKYTTQPE